MSIENIENHMAHACKCGSVNFALLKSGAIECNKCSNIVSGAQWSLAQPESATSQPDMKDAYAGACEDVNDYTPLIHSLRHGYPSKLRIEAADALEVLQAQLKEIAQPDCRTCDYYVKFEGCTRNSKFGACTNGDKYEAAPRVVLWRTEP